MNNRSSVFWVVTEWSQVKIWRCFGESPFTIFSRMLLPVCTASYCKRRYF